MTQEQQPETVQETNLNEPSATSIAEIETKNNSAATENELSDNNTTNTDNETLATKDHEQDSSEHVDNEVTEKVQNTSESSEQKDDQDKKNQKEKLTNYKTILPPRAITLQYPQVKRQKIEEQKLVFTLNEKKTQALEEKNYRFIPKDLFPPIGKLNHTCNFLYTATEYLRKEHIEHQPAINFILKFKTENFFEKHNYFPKKFRSDQEDSFFFYSKQQVKLENFQLPLIEKIKDTIKVRQRNSLLSDAQQNSEGIIESRLSENLVLLSEIVKTCGVLPGNQESILIEYETIKNLHCTDFCIITNSLLPTKERAIIEIISEYEFYIDKTLYNSFQIRDYDSSAKLINHLLTAMRKLGFDQKALSAPEQYLSFKIYPWKQDPKKNNETQKPVTVNTETSDNKKRFQTYYLFYNSQNPSYFFHLYHFSKQLIKQIFTILSENEIPEQHFKEHPIYYLNALLKQEKLDKISGLRDLLSAWLSFEVLYEYNRNPILWKFFMTKFFASITKEKKEYEILHTLFKRLTFLRLDLNVPVPLIFMNLSNTLNKLLRLNNIKNNSCNKRPKKQTQVSETKTKELSL